jgi:anti-anti-sigma factor
MSTIQAQVWKASAFGIERTQGKAPGTVIFRFSGPFTARDMFASLSPDALRNLFESPSDTAQAVRVFDLTGVPYMDSIGVGMMASQYVRCQGNGVRMVLAGVTPRVLQVLKLTKLDTFLPMTATVDDAEAL